MTQLTVRRFSARNLPALLRLSAARVGSRCFLRELAPDTHNDKPVECTFKQFENSVAATAEFLTQAGVRPFDRVLIVAENSKDYQVVVLAAQALRAEPACIFANLSATATANIALRTQPRCLFVSDESQWEKLKSSASTLVAGGLILRISPKPLKESVPGLQDCLASEIAETPYSQVVWNERVEAIGPNDPFQLLFTSGTTGKQKGVVVRQDAFVRAIEGGQAGTSMSDKDVGLMFLPFAHVAGQCQFMLAVALGHSLILVARREDLPVAFSMGPTYAFAVPMVYEKLLARVDQQIRTQPWPLRPLLTTSFSAATSPKLLGFPAFLNRVLTRIAHALIGPMFRRSLGGQLRMVASGGANAPPSVCRFFEAMGIPFISFYGMSESSGLICSQCIDSERQSDGVGLPTPDLELKVSDEGELLLKGPSLMAGYLDPEDNAVAYDNEGYFRTGDLVTLDAKTGQYRVVGRSKNLLVLSTGKKISPEPIETWLEARLAVSAALLVGNERPYLTAILFVPADLLTSFGTNDSTILSRLHTSVLQQLADFSPFEHPKRLLVIEGSPNDHPEFVTPTMKLKRETIVDNYDSLIRKLYETDSTSALLRRT